MLVILRSLTYGQALQTATTSINASRPFLEVLDAEMQRYEDARRTDRGAPIGEIGRLEVESLSFDYEPGTSVLRGISFVVESREAVGIVGPSGSGKSTLVQLLLRLRTPTGGVIRSEGRDIDELSATEWTRKVTFVPQQAHLIAGTIADNIRFFRDDVTQAQIEEASRLANLRTLSASRRVTADRSGSKARTSAAASNSDSSSRSLGREARCAHSRRTHERAGCARSASTLFGSRSACSVTG